MKTLMHFTLKTDWKLLREQKISLIKAANTNVNAKITSKDREHLVGLLHFIDTLQDFIVDEGYSTEEKIFRKP